MSSGSYARPQRGFAYVFVLVFLAVIGTELAFVGELTSHAARREREAQLLWVGEQYRRAIALYYERTPGAVKRYPEKLEDLLEDRRFLTSQRYLRRLYPDPITGRVDWNLIQSPEGGVMGVSSRSEAKPVKTGGLPEAEQAFAGAARYSSWQFTYVPASAGTAAWMGSAGRGPSGAPVQ